MCVCVGWGGVGRGLSSDPDMSYKSADCCGGSRFTRRFTRLTNCKKLKLYSLSAVLYIFA